MLIHVQNPNNYLIFIFLVLLILSFTFSFSVLHWIFTQDLAWGKVVIYMYSMYLVFCCLFWVIFFSHLDSPLRRQTVPQIFIYCISYKLGLPCILLMFICSFLDHVQYSYYYWHSDSDRVKLPLLFFFFLLYFQVFVFTYVICWHWLIN